ncbi:MAG: serine/threonine-protein kinase [Phycisphaerae bacterium]|jgi:serine/threonine protein kinase
MAYTYKHGDRPVEGYTIQRAVGRGGFGEVYYAVSDGGREVAIKYLRDNPQVELRGVSNCINLKSPHLVSIFDVKKTTDGEYAIIMEYCSGPSLRDLLIAEPDGFEPQKAAFFLREIGKGLSYLHDRGIVHRDLKPGNIFFDDGYVKIGDYGLSKFISISRHSGQTASVGTVHYMAPEIGSGNYSRGVDIYALGVILYEMLLGKVPFEGSSMAEVLMKHLTTQPELDQLHHPFGTIIRRSLEKDPNDRYPTVDEMVEAALEVDTLRNSLAGFSAKSLEGAARLGAPDHTPSPMPSPNPPPQQAPGHAPRPQAPHRPLPYAQPLGSDMALSNRLQKKIDRREKKFEQKIAKLEGRRPRPMPRATKKPRPPAAPGVHDPSALSRGDRGKRLVLCILFSIGLAVGLGLLIGNAQGSEEYGLSAGFLTVLMSGGILLSRALIGWFGVLYGPRWAQQLITLCACAPLTAAGSAPILDLNDEQGMALWLGMLAVAFFHRHDRERDSTGEIRFGCAFGAAVWGMVCTAILAGIFNTDPSEVMFIGAGVAGAVSLIVQSTSWWRAGRPPRGDDDRKSGQREEGLPPPHASLVEAQQTPTPADTMEDSHRRDMAVQQDSGHMIDPSSDPSQDVRLRWGVTRAFWGLIAFVLMGTSIATFLIAVIGRDFAHADITTAIVVCIGSALFTLFALRRTTPVRKEGFWRETLRPFLLCTMGLGIGGAITGIVREWDRCYDDEPRIAMLTGLVMCSVIFLILLFFTGRKRRVHTPKPFLLDEDACCGTPGVGALQPPYAADGNQVEG